MAPVSMNQRSFINAFEDLQDAFSAEKKPRAYHQRNLDRNLEKVEARGERLWRERTGQRRVKQLLDQKLDAKAIYFCMLALATTEFVKPRWVGWFNRWWSQTQIPDSFRVYYLEIADKDFNEILASDLPGSGQKASSESPRFSTPAEPLPITTANDSSAFEMRAPRWEKIQAYWADPIVDALRAKEEHTNPSSIVQNVRGRWPRTLTGDAIITLVDCNLGLKRLLRGHKEGLAMKDVRHLFGNTIAEAIEESDLRMWEVRNGRGDRTQCVEMFKNYRLQRTDITVRIARDPAIAQKLFS